MSLLELAATMGLILRTIMSAQATRLAPDATPIADDHGCAVQAGNRALESIGRHEALRALLAFSELHERIRARRVASQSIPDDLYQTERFVLDEVLQLICDRALEVTGAHGIVLALADGPAIICRASSGTALIDRGTRLRVDSEFLAECLVSGKIVRCDDAESDPRVALDLVRQVGATSSVLVPLRGTHARLGVLQAFSRIPLGFSNNDVRCLDLFGELVLSALKPEDQDRRINWLSDLASEVLAPKATIAEPPVVEDLEQEPAVVEEAIQSRTPGPARTAAAPAPAVEPVSSVARSQDASAETSSEMPAIVSFAIADEPEDIDAPTPSLHWLPELASSRPGLSVVLGLIAVAALFSFGVWWGMRGTTKTSGASKSMVATRAAAAGDNLMDPARFAPQEASTSAPNKPFPKITGIRHWSSAVGSTVVLDMDDQVPYEVHRLMSPERIYFDLHNTALAPSLDGQSVDVGDVALSRVRIAQPIPGVTRLVLDTRDGSNFSVSMETNPYRLIIELRPNDGAVAANSHPTPQAERKPAPAGTTPSPTATRPGDERLAARTGKYRIVLDAGHGGWDLGTVGREGLVEKDLVLDVTQRLGKLLQERLGVDVVFTRTTDDYLPLEQRADLANQAQADLFVSVHANYSNSANARGVETYYSNFFAAPGSKEIENRENGGEVKLPTVSLSANSLEEKIQESRHLAASVQRSLYAALAPKSPDIRDRGIKDAAFVVLTGTTMPAILTEISFVSSPADERNLQSEAYREQIAEALYKGIARYEESTHVKVAQVRSTSAGR